MALVLLGALLPFELARPVLSLGPVGVTSVELALYLVLVIWIAGRPRTRWTGMHAAVAVWVVTVLVAALLAPAGRGETLKFALRSVGGAALFFATVDLVTTRRQIAWIALGVSMGAVVSAATALGEVWVPAVRTGLEAFKTQASYAGGFLRASGSFQYANTAGMYWEAVLPLTLTLGAWAVTADELGGRRSAAWRWTGAAAGTLLAQALVLSASRAAWWTAAGLLAVLLAAAVRFSPPLRTPVVVVCAALTLFTVGGWGGGGLLALRLLASDEATWLNATFDDPPARLTLPVGTVTTVPITVRNTGRRDWPREGDTPVHLSYHWVAPDGDEILVWNGARTPLADTVAPGETIALQAVVDSNVPPGRYRLRWDMVQEQITWFSALGVEAATTWVDVADRDDAPAIAELPPPITVVDTTEPPRRALWAAAVGMWAERPLVGIGPDQFRHQYGGHLNLEAFDDRIHASSLYLETLVGQGLLGLLALVGLLATLARTVAGGWRLVDPSARILGLGLALGVTAYAAHGVVDHFLAFTPTYGLFWLLTALTVRLFSREVMT